MGYVVSFGWDSVRWSTDDIFKAKLAILLDDELTLESAGGKSGFQVT